MTPLPNKKSFLDLICSCKLHVNLFNAISEISRFLQIPLFSGAANKTFQETCGLSFLSSVLQVTSRLTDICLLTNICPSYMTHPGCELLPFSLNLWFTFFVIYFVLICKSCWSAYETF